MIAKFYLYATVLPYKNYFRYQAVPLQRYPRKQKPPRIVYQKAIGEVWLNNNIHYELVNILRQSVTRCNRPGLGSNPKSSKHKCNRRHTKANFQKGINTFDNPSFL